MVTDYKNQCGYSVGTLKDFIYLIPYNADRFSYSIDNGMCSEVTMNLNNGIVRIDGFQTTLKNTETLDGRFKYESEVSIYIHETLGQNFFDRMRYLIQNRWFVVVEDMQGVQYIQSVEFYSEFEYNLSLTDQNNAQNRIQLKFKGASNFPTMIMGTIKEIIAYARENEKAWGKNIRFTMTTNATLLTEEMMDFMDKEMGNIILSLDGRKEVNDNVRIKVDGSGSYDDILPNIKKMISKRDKRKTYYVRGTFTHANTDFYEDVKAMVHEGFREISIEPVVLEDGHPLALTESDLPIIS